MAFRSKSIFGIALVAAVFAAANDCGEKPKASPPQPVVIGSSLKVAFETAIAPVLNTDL